MRNGISIFWAAFITLGASWCGFVLAPVMQLGGAKQTVILQTTDNWPLQRTGDATLGLQIYRANGCAACHTEQVRQEGVACEVELTSVGKNPAAVQKEINAHLPVFNQIYFLTNSQNLPYGGPMPVDVLHLPQPVANAMEKSQADILANGITAAGGKSEVRLFATGADIARGWGVRQSVAADYLYDQPVQFGSLRAGPDLADIGVRRPDANWLLLHLYAPNSVNPNSTMPSFKFLFEVRKKINGATSPDALNLPKEFAPADDFEIVPKTDAKQLAAYLLSLRADAPLYEAPFSPPQTSTNAPANKK